MRFFFNAPLTHGRAKSHFINKHVVLYYGSNLLHLLKKGKHNRVKTREIFFYFFSKTTHFSALRRGQLLTSPRCRLPASTGRLAHAFVELQQAATLGVFLLWKCLMFPGRHICKRLIVMSETTIQPFGNPFRVLYY